MYNKVHEFNTFVEQENVDVIFMIELWEREEKTLSEIIKLDDHQIISNVYQRKGKGGRPALIVNKKKFEVQNLTNTLLNIKWGVEAVWCILTPKNVTPSSKIQKIACGSIYCKPGSKNKSDLQDHIAEAFNILSTKYQRGLHVIVAGDTNELNLTPILNISPHRAPHLHPQARRKGPAARARDDRRRQDWLAKRQQPVQKQPDSRTALEQEQEDLEILQTSASSVETETEIPQLDGPAETDVSDISAESVSVKKETDPVILELQDNGYAKIVTAPDEPPPTQVFHPKLGIGTSPRHSKLKDKNCVEYTFKIGKFHIELYPYPIYYSVV